MAARVQEREEATTVAALAAEEAAAEEAALQEAYVQAEEAARQAAEVALAGDQQELETVPLLLQQQPTLPLSVPSQSLQPPTTPVQPPPHVHPIPPLAPVKVRVIVEDLCKMKSKELSAELKKRGLPCKGVKTVLAQRLADAVANQEGAAVQARCHCMNGIYD